MRPTTGSWGCVQQPGTARAVRPAAPKAVSDIPRTLTRALSRSLVAGWPRRAALSVPGDEPARLERFEDRRGAAVVVDVAGVVAPPEGPRAPDESWLVCDRATVGGPAQAAILAEANADD